MLKATEIIDIVETNKTRVGLPVIKDGEAQSDSVVLRYDKQDKGVTCYVDDGLLYCSNLTYYCDWTPLPRECLKHFMPLILREVKDD